MWYVTFRIPGHDGDDDTPAVAETRFLAVGGVPDYLPVYEIQGDPHDPDMRLWPTPMVFPLCERWLHDPELITPPTRVSEDELRDLFPRPVPRPEPHDAIAEYVRLHESSAS